MRCVHGSQERCRYRVGMAPRRERFLTAAPNAPSPGKIVGAVLAASRASSLRSSWRTLDPAAGSSGVADYGEGPLSSQCADWPPAIHPAMVEVRTKTIEEKEETNGQVCRAGWAHVKLHPRGDEPEGQAPQLPGDRDQRRGAGQRHHGYSGQSASLHRGGLTELLARRDPLAARRGAGGGGPRAATEQGAEERPARRLRSRQTCCATTTWRASSTSRSARTRPCASSSRSMRRSCGTSRRLSSETG